MEKYRFLPHTADMAFEAYGKDLKQAIENSALALLSVMLDLKKVRSAKGRSIGKRIVEKADTVEDLVWFTLQDILSNVDAEYLKAYDFKIDKIESDNKSALSGRILHKRISGDYFLLGVKAVTPHDLSIKKRKGVYSIHVVIDV